MYRLCNGFLKIYIWNERDGGSQASLMHLSCIVHGMDLTVEELESSQQFKRLNHLQ